MSEGQSSQRMSFSSPASVSVRPHNRQRAGARWVRLGVAPTGLVKPRSTPPGPPPAVRPAVAVEPGRSPSRKRLGGGWGGPGGAGERPGDVKALTGAGDTDIEEPALLLDLLVRLRVGDRHHA